MDAVFNKLKTKVSGALPGNPLTREYDIEKQIGQSGLGLLWKLYSAKKRSTHQEATIWIMEKKLLESYPKLQRESMIDILKYGVSTLTRIKHPKIVSVIQPLEESRESLAYASEPLFTSLNNVLSKESANIEQYNESMEFALSDTEIKYGLVQLAEALNFLHCDCHRLHLNLTPESIVINRFGIWKLGGFDFSKATDQVEKLEQSTVRIPVWQSNLMPTCQLSLNASSPEAILQGEVTAASDMFSLGLLICTLFNRGKSILYVGNDYSAYKRMVKQLPSTLSSKGLNLPNNLKEYVKMMLSPDPLIRPDAVQFLRTPYFEDASMSVLRSVDNMYQLDNLARSQFYKSLPNSIHALPKRLCLFRVFPQIAEDFSNPHMVPFILPAVLQILDLVTQDEFIQYMLPRLIPVMTMKEPIQIILIFLQNLHILSEKFPVKEFRNYVLPILQLALDTDNKMIQELCLKSLPTIGKAMDLNLLKNSLLPRIQRLCLSTEYLSTRMNCLLCIGKLLDHLDKWIVMDDILPFLQQIKSREPIILMAIFGIYRLAFSHERLGINREKLATKVLPYLIPLSIESSLNLKQYSAYATLIHDMCSHLEREQYAKLEQLHGATDEDSMIKIGNIDESIWTTANSCSDLMTRIICTYLDDVDHYVKSSTTLSATLTTNSIINNNLSITSFGGSTNVKEVNNSSITNESVHLSLEQKRQLAAKQDQIERLSSNLIASPPVQPVSGPMKLTHKPKPIDITNTLITYNVNAINSTSDMMNKSNSQSNRLGTGIPLALMTPPPTQQQLYKQNGVNFNSLYSNNPGQVQLTISPNPIVPFCDTIKPIQQPQQHTPYATSCQLFSTTMPVMSNDNASNSNNIKPLSKGDIDDLLS
ncbi:hypothetical protein MN116_005622 [Schistosoma mekongi]|uniref:Protein kinase domain-containing protein n=1 Tax=Schistosoma mekongi TaxID=38744 RepID=A0AAE1ZBQ5_SCHME|nr:hypothetical protein MN116_005622 [Schistosoma mekongi]